MKIILDGAKDQYVLNQGSDLEEQTIRNTALGISSRKVYVTEKLESFLQIIFGAENCNTFKSNWHSFIKVEVQIFPMMLHTLET